MNGDATTNSFYPDLRRKLNNDAWPFIPKLFLMMMDVYQVLNDDRQGMIELQVRIMRLADRSMHDPADCSRIRWSYYRLSCLSACVKQHLRSGCPEANTH